MDTKLLLRTTALALVLAGMLYHDTLAQKNADNPVEELMELAIAQMNDGDYEAANITFRKILKLNTVLPDDLSYLFAETLYMVNQ